MTLTFSAHIEGRTIRCLIGSDTPVARPVFCFSLMAPARVVGGGEIIRSVAGYTEVALPDLTGKAPLELILEHANPDFAPVNRAWLPLGPYLRHAGGCTPLPAVPAGVIAAAPPEPVPPCPGLRLVPAPTQWQPGAGTLDAGKGFAAGAILVAVDDLARRARLGPFLAADGAPVTLHPDDTLPPEAYRLNITPAGIALHHADAAGAFYAGITLLTLRQTHQNHLPCGLMQDAPRFGWRGQHLDCARHFYRPDTLHRLLDLMALLKLNRFHWHFADDEAFRLQVEYAPDLWQKTAYRGEGELVPGVFGGGIRSGGSYGPADVSALLAHAAALHIEVLPEIEVPAHAHALNLAIPGLTDPRDPRPETSIQGYPHNIVNPAVPATLDFLEPLAVEVASLFPIGILHLGCDELPPAAWERSPDAALLKQAQGLANRDDLQGWMMERLAATLAAQDIRPAAWEEAAKGANGGIGHNALLFSWTGQGPGIAAARAGYDVVMCPAQHAYLDMAHTASPQDWGAAWAAFIPLEETVNWSPVPAGARDVEHRIVGVQGTYWSEFTTSDEQIEPMLAPRILGIACKAWEQAEATDGPRLRQLAASWGPIFDAMAWARNRNA